MMTGLPALAAFVILSGAPTGTLGHGSNEAFVVPTGGLAGMALDVPCLRDDQARADCFGMWSPTPRYWLPAAMREPVSVNPVSAALDLEQATILIDPVGDQSQYRRFGRPDIVVLTRAHPDHLSPQTMIGLLRRDTVVLATQAVIDELPLMISNNVISPFDAGDVQEVRGITFTALDGAKSLPVGANVHAREPGAIRVGIEIDGTTVYF